MQETQETRDEVEIDLKELFWLMVQNLKWILLSMVVGGAAAFLITVYLVAPKYTSAVSLYVNNTGDDAKTATTAMNINDINASQKLVNTYIVILQDDKVMRQVADELLQEYDPGYLEMVQNLTPEGLRNTIKMSAVNNTEVLRIEANTTSPELSARICTIITELAPEILERVVKAGSVEVIGEALPAASPSSPNVMRNTMIGLAIGMALAVIVVLLRYFLDNTIKDEEDLKSHHNVPVLGEIPNFETAGKGGY